LIWIGLKEKFLHTSDAAEKKLLTFPPIYLWETAFLRYAEAEMVY
jgi:hypothetical protein